MSISLFLQSSVTLVLILNLSNSNSPQPIAAGRPNSAHLIAIWEAIPPYFVINPAGFFEKIQSNPGSAFSININLESISTDVSILSNRSVTSVTFLLVI